MNLSNWKKFKLRNYDTKYIYFFTFCSVQCFKFVMSTYLWFAGEKIWFVKVRVHYIGVRNIESLLYFQLCCGWLGDFDESLQFKRSVTCLKYAAACLKWPFTCLEYTVAQLNMRPHVEITKYLEIFGRMVTCSHHIIFNVNIFASQNMWPHF